MAYLINPIPDGFQLKATERGRSIDKADRELGYAARGVSLSVGKNCAARARYFAVPTGSIRADAVSALGLGAIEGCVGTVDRCHAVGVVASCNGDAA